MTRIAIIAAMAGELKPLIRGWQHERRNGVDLWRMRSEDAVWVAACAGAGQPAATRAFAEIEADSPIDLVFSIGWAGALTTAVPSGSAHNIAGVIDVRTGERFYCDAGAGELWLVTSPIVAGEPEKLRLAAAYPAALVDMEAAAIARLAQMRGIPFYCVKGVSDGPADKLPDFNRFIDASGQFHIARFILFALLRPGHWPALARMGENSKQASQAIADSLLEILNERGTGRNGDSNHNR